MGRRRSDDLGFSTSLLDTVSCGLGGAILLLIVWAANVEAHGDVTKHAEKDSPEWTGFDLMVTAWGTPGLAALKLEAVGGDSSVVKFSPAFHSYRETWEGDAAAPNDCAPGGGAMRLAAHTAHWRTKTQLKTSVFRVSVPDASATCACELHFVTVARAQTMPCPTSPIRVERIGDTYRIGAGP